MATEILATMRCSYKSNLANDSIRWRIVGGYDNPSYAVIAKGNVFEGIKAEW